jgi:tetratricopeptide (TPR) repeat protein
LKDFFISYNKADRAWAEWIAWQLEEAGYSTEIQAWDFRPGSNFVLEMHRAVQGVERTVAVLSPDYLQALYTQPEWAAAFAQDPTGGEQKLLPVQVRECALKGLLGQVIYIDLVGREENAARDELFKGVSSDRAKPEIPPSFPAAFPHSLSERPPFPGASASAEPYNPSIGWLRRVWNGLTESRMKKLAFIGAFIAALGGIGWQVYTHFSKPETSEALAKVEANQVSIAAGGDVNIGGNVSTHITDIHGVSEEKFQQLSEELGVTKAALKRFFKTLEHKEVPPEDIDSTLRTIAERYKDLQKKLEEVSGEDTAVAEFKRQVKEALDVGDFDRAEKLLNEASAKDLEAARSMQERAKQRLLSAAASKAKNGDLKYTQLAYAEAAEYYRQAAERVPAGEELILAGYLNLQSWASYEAGRYADAQQPLERALALREKLLGPEHLDVAQSLNNLAALYHAQGQYAKAESLYQRALAIREKALGPVHPDTAASLTSLAGLYWATGAYGKAEPLYQRALAIYEQAFGPDHPYTAASLSNLAVLYRAMGAYGKAEPLYQRALAIYEQALGPAHHDTARSLSNLAMLYDIMGAYGKAEPLYQRALAIYEQALGPDHPSMVTSLNNLAGLYRDMGAYGKAEPLYQRALAISEKALGSDHPNRAASLNGLAVLFWAQGRWSKAEDSFRRGTQIEESNA